MGIWYDRVLGSNCDLGTVLDACEWFETEIGKAANEVVMKGKRLAEIEMEVPSLKLYRRHQLAEVEAILAEIESHEESAKADAMQRFLEHYNRQLSEKTARDWGEQRDQKVIDIATVRRKVAYVRNLYAHHVAALETMDWRCADLVKIHTQGLAAFILE